MVFKQEDISCKPKIKIAKIDSAHNKIVKCHKCSIDLPKPDIMTAYQHVGQSLSELYKCCSNNDIDSSPPKHPQ